MAALITLATASWLTDLVQAIHANSRGTYGWRRVNAELLNGHSVIVNRKTVHKIMRLHGLHGCQDHGRASAARPTWRVPLIWSSAGSPS